MTDFAEQLRRKFNSRPAPSSDFIPRLAALAPVPAPSFNKETDLQGFTFDQYDGSALGFYVEIDAENLSEATARLKDMVSEQEPIEVELGTINGKPVYGRIVFHPDGIRPGYFKHRRRW